VDGGVPAEAAAAVVDGGTSAAAAAAVAVDAGTPAAATPAAAAPAAAAPQAPEGGGTTRADVPVAAGSDVIVEIRAEGNRRVEPEVVKRALKNKLGRPFDPALTGQDVQALWGLGYFQDVQLLTQRLPNGIAYVIRVSERPSVREWRLQGNEEMNKDDF